MFYRGYLRECQNLCKRAISEYDKTVVEFTKSAMELNDAKICGNRLLCVTEDIINSIAHTPKYIQEPIKKIKKNVENYRHIVQQFNDYNEKMMTRNKVTGGSAMVAAGAGLAAPTGIMAIATTFGTASTGTAIATLHGAAATNAALAWIGGGALSVGGGGIGAGNAILAACGPVGWIAAGTLIFAGMGFNAWSNKKEGEKIRRNASRITMKAKEMKKQDAMVKTKKLEMQQILCGFEEIVNLTLELKNAKYNELDEINQNRLVDLVNKAVICSEYVRWSL